ncbi:uncharacterized protein [Paramisgurnus dabryanus]|uniref:uncharacterized protein n=1 Tax=Paramisgurnus dabryanus TaxID=90735 RepID=UPI003CCF2746
MATTPPPQSTFVDMEDFDAPSISTPNWPYSLRQPPIPGDQSHGSVLYGHTTTQSSVYPETHMYVKSPTLPPPEQPLTWATGNDHMQLCTSTEITSPSLSSVVQQDLPGVLPTPGREIPQRFTAQFQSNWDQLMQSMDRQEETLKELTQAMKTSSSHHKIQITELAAQVESNKHQVITLLTADKQQETSQIDQLLKAVKLMISEELHDRESLIINEIRFMVEQLQVEVQQDLKGMKDTFLKSFDQLTSKMEQCAIQADKCLTGVADLNEKFQASPEETVETVSTQTTQVPDTSHSLPPSTEIVPNLLLNPIIKSDHIRLTFPTFGRPMDDVDPLLYLTKCHDFLALHPLSDADLMATFRTVLHGTARDWWEVSRSSIATWKEFETAFRSAFLAEDYEDELAERVRTKIQGEKETIRDFAFTYRALCRRWKADFTENEIVKMILKNIKPYLASQLRGRVNTVEDLVRLGHQLERDHEQQLRYEGRLEHKQVKSLPNRQTEKPPVLCWRCNGQHSPGNCPMYAPPASQQSSGQQYNRSKPSHHSAKSGGRSTNNTVAASSENTQPQRELQRNPAPMTIPQQLVVPVRLATWMGKAIVDTGASYTLIHESLLKQFATLEQVQQWTCGPLYLANGQAERPIGWLNATIQLQDKAVTLPVVILSSQALAYAIVLGLDFIFFSGLQIDVSELKYYFKYDLTKEYPFQPGNASEPLMSLPLKEEGKLPKKVPSNMTLLSAIPPPQPLCTMLHNDTTDDVTLIKDAVGKAHLPPDAKHHLTQILGSHPKVCTHRIGRTDVLQHCIYTTCQVPIKQRPYRLNPVKQQAMEEQLEVMLRDGIVEPSHSSWASPVVMVPKKDGKLRFCVDYRKINAITESDAYPIPNISEILESLSGASIFSSIDLNSGYWQVNMDPNSKAQTAFIVSAGLYHFNTMPFGLKNAPATFQRLMEKVLEDLRSKICFVYIDDIIIYSSTESQHLQDLQSVLQRLENAGLTINLKKCKFCLSEITFLGHVVSAKGITADLSKVEAIRNFPVPRNLKEVQRFLGLAGWYHRFVQDFSKIAEPLNTLKKKGQMFNWSPQCQQAFDQLKANLITPPVLGHPDLQVPFIIYTDASDAGLGAILTQRKDPNNEVVISYASRTLNRAEVNYSATEKECLAVVWALEKWQHYIEHKLFTVVTDHAALQWVMGSTKANSRLIRWVLRLQKFNFIIEYRKGKLNAAPDALSRSPIPAKCTLYTKQQTTPHSELPITDVVLWEEQHKDDEIVKLFQEIVNKQIPQMEQYEVIEDKLYRKMQRANDQTQHRVYVPASLRPTLLEHYHSHPLSGHLGIYKTYKRLQEVAFWPRLWSDVRQYVKRCVKCQTLKHDNQKPAGKLQSITVTRPNEMLGVDIMGPLPKSTQQNEYLLVFVDYFTRWSEFFPMRKATAQNIAKIVRQEILTRWGVPDFILSDRGSQFMSSVFKEICLKWKVTPKLTTAYHPQTNMTERVNRTLKNMISVYVDDNHSKWDQFLPELRFAMNSAIQETIGVSPAELQLGRKLKGPMDKILHGTNLTPDDSCYDVVTHLKHLQAQARESIRRSQHRQLRNYNKKRQDVTFKNKDRVWLRNFPLSSAQNKFSAKLAPKWRGPYRVLKQLGPLNYRITLEATGEDLRTAHVCNLKMCYPTAEELESQERIRLQDLFHETSDEEDFLGF